MSETKFMLTINCLGRKNKPTNIQTTVRGISVFKWLWIKAFIIWLSCLASFWRCNSNWEPWDHLIQAGKARQKKAPLSQHLKRWSPIATPGRRKKSHSRLLTWRSHKHHLQVYAQQILSRTALELMVLTQKELHQHLKQSDQSILIQGGIKVPQVQCKKSAEKQ